MGALAVLQPMCSSDRASAYLTPDTSKIVMASLDSKQRSVWRRCLEFSKANGIKATLPVSVTLLLNFLTSLFHLGYQPSTIASHAFACLYP